MNRAIPAAALLLPMMLGCAASGGLQAPDFSPDERSLAVETARAWGPRIVSVRSKGHGSGFIMPDPKQVTAEGGGAVVHTTRHNLATGAERATVIIRKGPTLDCRVDRVQPRHDLAFLTSDKLPVPKDLRITAGSPQLGEPIIVLSRDREGHLRAAGGRVRARGLNLPPTLLGLTSHGVKLAVGEAIIHDAPVQPGDSGGPVLDLSGRVIGINLGGNRRKGLFVAAPFNRDPFIPDFDSLEREVSWLISGFRVLAGHLQRDSLELERRIDILQTRVKQRIADEVPPRLIMGKLWRDLFRALD